MRAAARVAQVIAFARAALLVLAVAAASLTVALPCRAEDYFYRGRDFGSESLVDPVRLVVNGGYGILQLDNRDNGLAGVHYRAGAENLWKNLAHPVASIETVGWETFLTSEVLPFSLKPRQAYYWPNYTQHLIGGGMSSRMMEEWYRQHGREHARAWSWSTIAVYHVLNEVVENDDFRGYRPDPVADIYIFNTAGVYLFSHDRVCRFFAHTLNLSDWSYQPVVVPRGAKLENGGQNFAMKYRIPGRDRTYLFYHFGTHGEVGLSWRKANGDAFSIAGGFRSADLVEVAHGVNTVDLGVSGGIFYDRGNSLLASLQFARTKDYQVRLNVYPGVVHLGRWSPGLVAARNRDNSVLLGIHLGGSPLVPVGVGTVLAPR
jgi:hypothetical protein